MSICTVFAMQVGWKNREWPGGQPDEHRSMLLISIKSQYENKRDSNKQNKKNKQTTNQPSKQKNPNNKHTNKQKASKTNKPNKNIGNINTPNRSNEYGGLPLVVVQTVVATPVDGPVTVHRDGHQREDGAERQAEVTENPSPAHHLKTNRLRSAETGREDCRIENGREWDGARDDQQGTQGTEEPHSTDKVQSTHTQRTRCRGVTLNGQGKEHSHSTDKV